MLNEVTISCPYCGESFQMVIDDSDAGQEYYEDCAICCRPILVSVHGESDDGSVTVSVRREDDTPDTEL